MAGDELGTALVEPFAWDLAAIALVGNESGRGLHRFDIALATLQSWTFPGVGSRYQPQSATELDLQNLKFFI